MPQAAPDDDLFQSISEAHYLPELSGPHDEALLDSLVEKGCEDNQILGQALDKLAHLVHSGEYAEEEDELLLGGAPVADIIERLGQSLESPHRSSMSAAQGLLHLHQPPYLYPPADDPQSAESVAHHDDITHHSEIPHLTDISHHSDVQHLTDMSHHPDMQHHRDMQIHTDMQHHSEMQHSTDMQRATDLQHHTDIPHHTDLQHHSELQHHADMQHLMEMEHQTELQHQSDMQQQEHRTEIQDTIHLQNHPDLHDLAEVSHCTNLQHHSTIGSHTDLQHNEEIESEIAHFTDLSHLTNLTHNNNMEKEVELSDITQAIEMHQGSDESHVDDVTHLPQVPDISDVSHITEKSELDHKPLTHVLNDTSTPENVTELLEFNGLQSLTDLPEISEAIVTNKIEEEEMPSSNLDYIENLPKVHDEYQEKQVKSPQQSLPDQSDAKNNCELVLKQEISDNISDSVFEEPNEIEKNALSCNQNKNIPVSPAADIDFSTLEPEMESNEPTDLSIRHDKSTQPQNLSNVMETTQSIEDNLSDKSDEQPKDLSFHRRLPTPHASPRRLEIPRAPSRESDAMQSPQPSGIPAVPSSPEIFSVPQTKSKQTLFLETLLSSPSPKMYTSEVTITKQQCEPLNLGKHRKSASPTVSSYSDEMRKLGKEFGEPYEKRIRRESTDDIVKISKVFSKDRDETSPDKCKKVERPLKSSDEHSPRKQLQALKTSSDFNMPDPILVPKNKLNDILAAPGREIPALLIQRPELRLPEAFAYPSVLQDPDILVVSLAQLENIIENDTNTKNSESKQVKQTTSSSSKCSETHSNKSDSTSQSKQVPSIDALAGDIDAATSAALNQMLWLPYLSQLEAAMACSQNMDFLKALNSSGYSPSNYAEMSQMFNPSSRFMGAGGFPIMPQMDYENRLQFAMWQEAMNQANASRSKSSSAETQMKELSKSTDVQNPYVHSTKNHQTKPHSSARTSPIAHNYSNSCQRGSLSHNPFLQGMYPGMNPNVRPNMPLPGLQIPYFNPNVMSSQRSPRTSQQKSPTSSYYPNNNYLQSVNKPESSHRGSMESPRPRISVKSLQNLLEPAAVAAASSGGVPARRSSSSSLGRRRDEPEVGSTTPLGEPPPHHPHPHDPTHHLWHPLFGNQKGYNSPWSWTTVTATGD